MLGTMIGIVIQIILPVVFLIIFKRRWKIPWKVVMIGFLSFFVFTIILRALLYYFLEVNQTTKEWIVETPILIVLFAAIAAGIFEEIGRYISYRFLLKEYRERKDGIAFGIGHGGMEAILAGILAGVFVLSMPFEILETFEIFKWTGALGAFATLQLVMILFNGDHYILTGFGQLAALGIQIALSVLMLYGIRQKKISLLLLIIFLNIGINMVVVLDWIGFLSWTTAENIICVLGLIALYFIIYSETIFKKSESEEDWDSIDRVLRELFSKSESKG